MRSPDVQQLGMFSYVSVESRVPSDHPIRRMRILVDMILKDLDPLFRERYAEDGRPSIPPERLLRAAFLQVLYSVRSARLLMEQLDYNLLFRWFVGLNIDDPVWDHSTFTANRDRLFDVEVAQRFFAHTVLIAEARDLVSDQHFTVDGSLLEAWASHKSFQRKASSDDPGESGGMSGSDERESDGSDFRGEKRSNATHESKTDPDARLFRKGKGKEAKLSFMCNLLMENRNGLIVGVDTRLVTGTAEREGALALLDARSPQRGASVGADKLYDCADFVEQLKSRGLKPHIARNQKGRKSAVDGRTAASKSYALSQRIRKRIEQGFGWAKTVGSLRKLKLRGLAAVSGWVAWNMATLNLVRLGGMAGWWNPSPT
jgi:transposase